MTVSAVARYPDVERIDCVEIEPAVINAAPFLNSLNRDVLSDPRVHVIFDDARNFLLTTREKYDLIISEPSNPWIAGVATLFTDEFYAAVTPHPRSRRQIRSVAAILLARSRRFKNGRRDPCCLISQTSLCGVLQDRICFFSLEATTRHSNSAGFDPFGRTSPLRDDFESIDVHEPEALTAYFLLDDAALRKMSDGAAVNTDDRTSARVSRSPNRLDFQSLRNEPRTDRRASAAAPYP